MDNDLNKHIADTISKIVTEHWNDVGFPILLSQLGLSLSRKDISTKALFPNGGDFAHFIENLQDSHKIGLYRHSITPQKIAVYPLGEVDSADDEIFDSQKKTSRKFRSDVWRAFTIHADPSLIRTINIKEEQENFLDIPSSETPEDGYKVIPQKLLNTQNGFIPPTLVQKNIENWADHEEFDIADLELTSDSRSARGATDNPLTSFLSRLSDEQRRSLSLRGDIIHKFLE